MAEESAHSKKPGHPRCWAKDGEPGLFIQVIKHVMTCANVIDYPKEKSDIILWAWSRPDRFTIDVWRAGEFKAKTGHDRRHKGMGLPLMVGSVDEVQFARPHEGGGPGVALGVSLMGKQ